MAEAVSTFSAYLSTRESSLDFTSGPSGSYRVLEVGVWFYAEVTDAAGNVSHFEPFSSRSEADAFGRSSITPVVQNSLSVCNEEGVPVIGFSLEQYISSTITENGVSRFDYVAQNVAYEYRDIYRLNSWNRFQIYPPVITIASNQIKVISHRSAVLIQPSDVLITLPMSGDCSILDVYITTAVSAYRASFDALAGPVVRPDTTPSGWVSSDAALPATFTNPAYPGWSYLLSRGTGNRSYIISDVMHTDGTQLQVNGPSPTSTVVRLRDTAAFHRIGDAHSAARTAIENN